MIKALRVTSIIAAVLAAGFFAFPAAFGFRSDEEIEQLLSLPSVVEKFRQDRGGKRPGREGQISPLVKEAETFGLIINPPPKTPKPPKKTRKSSDDTQVAVVKPPPPPPPPPSVKFKVIATSCCESHPELSLALIDEPGKGRHWVRESAVVSHITIEQIKDGLVVVKGARGASEVAVEARPPQRSLLAGSSPVSMGPSSPTRSEPTAVLDSGEAESTTGVGSGITSSELEQMSAEEQAAFAERIFAELAAMTGEGLEKPEATEKPISGAESMRITGNEAKKLDRLGRELKGADEDSEQDPNQTKSSKIEGASKKRWKPRKPRKSSTSKPSG